MSIKELATNPKIGVVVSAATTGTGTWMILDWIPSDIGKVATVVGIILSIVLIYTHLRKGHIEYKKIQLEIEILEQERKNVFLNMPQQYQDIDESSNARDGITEQKK